MLITVRRLCYTLSLIHILSGNIAHNYYLYEKNGQLSLIPWDYNLAFGGFQSTDASSTINFPVDTPFSSGVSTEDRQFFMALLNLEEYREQYHAYLSQLVEAVSYTHLDVYKRQGLCQFQLSGPL